MVLDITKLKLEGEEDDFCFWSGAPKAQPGCQYSLCCDIDDLNLLGSGFPMYY